MFVAADWAASSSPSFSLSSSFRYGGAKLSHRAHWLSSCTNPCTGHIRGRWGCCSIQDSSLRSFSSRRKRQRNFLSTQKIFPTRGGAVSSTLNSRFFRVAQFFSVCRLHHRRESASCGGALLPSFLLFVFRRLRLRLRLFAALRFRRLPLRSSSSSPCCSPACVYGGALHSSKREREQKPPTRAGEPRERE